MPHKGKSKAQTAQRRRSGRGRRSKKGSISTNANPGERDSGMANNRMCVISPDTKAFGGFPSSFDVKLKYVDVSTLDCTGGSTTSLVYSLNSPYDPYTGIGGHSAGNFNKFAALYQRYCCYAAKFKFTPTPTSAEGSVACFFGVLVDTEGNQASGADTRFLMEQPFGIYGDTTATYNGGIGNYPLTAQVPIGPWFGIKSKKELLANPSVNVLCNTNPANNWNVYAEIWASPVEGVPPDSALTFKLEVEYSVIFNDLHPTSLS